MYKPESHTNEQLAEFIKQPGRNLVFMSTEWCGDCKIIKPFVEGLKEEITKSSNWMDADRDENLDWAADHGLKGIPTFVLFEDGKKVDQIGHGERITPKQIEEWYQGTLS
ncbi:thioredoxin family protein [Fructobacillus sp. W13]|uniref:Thioredoxin family protein n=1 Tax=Fructobacillus apis TaxID=2935017 RepID=A0ABT0ZPS8_9LACO|nr:thioredoxin family protein [Fructobacillus apis]MCO0831988.1 thioredoxin family protein [Fructobacillus apis]